jgi:hypothetical protein
VNSGLSYLITTVQANFDSKNEIAFKKTNRNVIPTMQVFMKKTIVENSSTCINDKKPDFIYYINSTSTLSCFTIFREKINVKIRFERL